MMMKVFRTMITSEQLPCQKEEGGPPQVRPRYEAPTTGKYEAYFVNLPLSQGSP